MDIVKRNRATSGDVERGTKIKTTQREGEHVISMHPSGKTDGGQWVDVPVTQQGHPEFAIRAPLLPFGAVHTESLTPIFQIDSVYGVNSGLVNTAVSGSGGATASDSSFVVSTGATVNSLATMQSRKRLRYRAGQGVIGRFTALFSAPVANNYQIIGLGHAEDGLYFGYVDSSGVVPEFGVLYVNRGVREVQTLTVTTRATTAGNVTVTLNGVAFTVPVEIGADTTRTAYEIASFASYTGWSAAPQGATVVFIADSAGNKAAAFSFGAGATGSAASFAETKAGVASTDLFIPRSTWNGDKLDGTGASGITLDPQKYNVYQINIQYLGAGHIDFQVEVAPSGVNGPNFVTAHTLKLPNSLTASSFGNPSFPFTMAVYSVGSTSNISMKCASFAGFVEGKKMLHGNRFSYVNSSTGITAANYHALFTVMNTRYYGGRSNQAVINLQTVSGALKHTSPCVFYLIKNGTLAGSPSFAQYATNSCSYYDSAATTVSFSSNDQIIATYHLGDTGEISERIATNENDEVTLQPGEWVTLAARAIFGNPAYVTGSLTTREDQ